MKNLKQHTKKAMTMKKWHSVNAARLETRNNQLSVVFDLVLFLLGSFFFLEKQKKDKTLSSASIYTQIWRFKRDIWNDEQT